jgi:rhamnosyltransferase
VLPTRNGAATIPALLDALRRQRVDFPFEIVAVDSASSDGTTELLRARVDRLITIPVHAFNHGLTRNAGIEQARGELIVLIVQDAVPAADGWLAALTAPLCGETRLAGTYARQIPRPDASAVTRYYLDRWQAASTEPRIVTVSDRKAFEALDPMTQLDWCTFDNVCSCIRRSVWARHPFPATPIGEDVEWARDVLMAGYSLAYVPAAEVIHSHDRSAWYELMRTYLLHRRLYDLFRLRTIPTLPLLARAVGSSLKTHLACQPFSPRAAALAFAWPLGQYLGPISAIYHAKATPSGTL